MREKNSILNIISNLFVIVLQIALVFVVRFIFVRVLNEQYLGVQGLFTNIISMLSLAELGIGTAISFILYKPLADKDYNKVSVIVTFLRKVYIAIGIVVLIAGIIITPFLKYIVTGYTMGSLNIIFIIYFITLAVEYFLTYPETLLTADQKHYKISFILISYTLITNVLQIIVLLFTKNFLIYILSDVIMKLIKFVSINIYVKKYYPKVNFYSKEKLEKEEKNKFTKNVKSLFLYKIGDYLINGTDNIIISKIIDISTVGIYSNYLSTITIFRNIINNIISGVTASFGNLIVKENEKIQKNVFNIMNFITYIFCGFVFCCLMFLFNDFIKIFYGENYMLGMTEVIIICLNFYIAAMLLPLESVKSAAGLYYEDRYVTIIQAIINVVVSIVLGRKMGLIGVLIGTFISYILTTVWERPMIIYKKIFKSNYLEYFKKYFVQIIMILFNICIDWLIINKLFTEINVINFILKGVIIFVIFMITNIIIYKNSKEFNYIYETILSKLKIMKNKKLEI